MKQVHVETTTLRRLRSMSAGASWWLCHVPVVRLTGPPPGLRLLRAALLAAVLTALCIPPSDALAAELLACQAKDAVNLQNDGTLKNGLTGKFVRTANGSRSK